MEMCQVGGKHLTGNDGGLAVHLPEGRPAVPDPCDKTG